MDVGGIHFKSKCKQIRHSNYTLKKIICEFVDNVIKKCQNINIETKINDNFIYEIKISDDYLNGFENIQNRKQNNPFNMGYIREGHNNDEETSEFGIGMKAAAIACANKFIVYTKTNNKYYKVIMNFVEMQEKEDINNSYNPTDFCEINETEYKKNHKFENGSTLILSEIRKEIYKQSTQEELTKVIKNDLIGTYNYYIKNINLKVNGEKIASVETFFDDTYAKIFNIASNIYILKNNYDKFKYFVENVNPILNKKNLYEYENNKINNLLCKKNITDKIKNIISENKKNGYHIFEPLKNDETNLYCIQITSTFTKFSKKFHNEITNDENDDDKTINIQPNNRLEIYKDNRKYCDKEISNRNNGRYNYSLHKMEFKSKKIGKIIGISFNKDISLDGNNDLIELIKEIIKTIHNKHFSADICSIQYKNLYDYAVKNNIKIKNNLEPKCKKNDNDNDKIIKSTKNISKINIKNEDSDDDSEDEDNDLKSIKQISLKQNHNKKVIVENSIKEPSPITKPNIANNKIITENIIKEPIIKKSMNNNNNVIMKNDNNNVIMKNDIKQKELITKPFSVEKNIIISKDIKKDFEVINTQKEYTIKLEKNGIENEIIIPYNDEFISKINDYFKKYNVIKLMLNEK